MRIGDKEINQCYQCPASHGSGYYNICGFLNTIEPTTMENNCPIVLAIIRVKSEVLEGCNKQVKEMLERIS